MTKVIDHNLETGEVIERDATNEEIAQQEKDAKDLALKIDKENEKKQRRADLLERLGITEEEAKLLLG